MDREQLKGLKILQEEKEICLGYGLRCIPYFGQYGEIYRLMHPMTVIKPTSVEGLGAMPSKVRKAVNDFATKYPKGDLDLFIINWDGDHFRKESLSHKQSSIRMNYITHPYVFYDLFPEEEKKTNVFMSLYKVCELDGISPIKDGDAVPIDAEFLLGKECERFVHAHPKWEKGKNIGMCASPNNAAFMLSIASPICSFFSLSVVTYKEYGRLLICLHTIISNSEAPLMRNLDELFNKKKMFIISLGQVKIDKSVLLRDQDKIYTKYVRQNFAEVCLRFCGVLSEAAEIFSKVEKYSDIEALEENLKYSGRVLLSRCGYFFETDPEADFLGEFFLEQFYKFLLKKLDCQELGISFARNLVKCCPISCQIGFIKLYLEALIEVFMKDAEYQFALLTQFSEDPEPFPEQGQEENDRSKKLFPEKKVGSREEGKISNIQKKFLSYLKSNIASAPHHDPFPKNTFLCEFIPTEIPQVSIFAKMIDKLLRDPSASINAEIDSLPWQMREYLYFSAWKFKGSPQNIHSNFGKVSFDGIPEIDKKYFMTKDEKILVSDKLVKFPL